MKRAEKRDYLIEVATRLFNQYGYHAVGIDQIIAAAGIAKTTLYRHFKSKEDLIVAVLQRVNAQSLSDMRLAVEMRVHDSKSKLLASFDFLEDWFKAKTFYGCPFMSAAAEYSEPTSPVFQEARIHKRLVIAYFEELARAAELDDPAQIAQEINLLHEGATAVAYINSDPTVARRAKAIAAVLIEGKGTSLNAFG
jgi:AcrR family transcriptional regulator